MPTIRLGLLTLPLAGLLVTWATVASSAYYNFSGAAVVGPKEVARASTSLPYFLSQFVGYILGLTLLTVGAFALTVYLSEFRRERWTLVAMVLSILGIGLLLSHYGLRTYALPVLGKAYLDGVQNAVVLANTILLDGLTRGVLYVAFLLYSAGFILFGFGVWGSAALPKWARAARVRASSKGGNTPKENWHRVVRRTSRTEEVWHAPARWWPADASDTTSATKWRDRPSLAE